MKTISTADIVFSTQILCIFCVLGLLIMWGLEFVGRYGLYSFAVVVIFTSVTPVSYTHLTLPTKRIV